MGIAYAKDYERINWQIPIRKPESNIQQQNPTNSLKLEDVQVRVDRVHINGLDRTKNDYVESAVTDLFNAENFQQVLVNSHQVRTRLDSLGCFKNVSILIDVSRGPNATPDGLEVTFDVSELGRLAGSVNTQVSNNEGSLVLGFRAPNIFGRGEKIQTEYSYGSHNSINFNFAFSKPFNGKYEPMLTTGVYQSNTQWPPSGYKQLDRGLTLGFGFKTHSLFKHNIQWDGMIRELSPLGLQTAFDIREQAGLSLKSALRHILTIDQRDETVFPTHGNLLQITTEFAGLGGNVGFLKNEFFSQQNSSIFEDFVLQFSQSGGVIHSANDEMKITLSDMYYLGGALSVRGFETRGIGPHSEANALGSTWFWSSGLHLFTPLPFRPGRGGFGELFRTHLFVNAGNIGNFTSSGCSICEEVFRNIRIAYGLGVAIRLANVARIEINYCIPYQYQQSDCPHPGIQFGVGMNFL